MQKKSAPRDFFYQKKSPPRDFWCSKKYPPAASWPAPLPINFANSLIVGIQVFRQKNCHFGKIKSEHIKTIPWKAFCYWHHEISGYYKIYRNLIVPWKDDALHSWFILWWQKTSKCWLKRSFHNIFTLLLNNSSSSLHAKTQLGRHPIVLSSRKTLFCSILFQPSECCDGMVRITNLDQFILLRVKWLGDEMIGDRLFWWATSGWNDL